MVKPVRTEPMTMIQPTMTTMIASSGLRVRGNPHEVSSTIGRVSASGKVSGRKPGSDFGIAAKEPDSRRGEGKKGPLVRRIRLKNRNNRQIHGSLIGETGLNWIRLGFHFPILREQRMRGMEANDGRRSRPRAVTQNPRRVAGPSCRRMDSSIRQPTTKHRPAQSSRGRGDSVSARPVSAEILGNLDD
jgi:hypothetical protein